VVPAGVPADIVKRLTEATLAIAAAEDVQKALRLQGVDPEPGPPQAVTAQIQKDIVKWRDVVASAKIGGAK
jgi:tripartite-type tricarboxylate transporter receptor subunit TctC